MVKKYFLTFILILLFTPARGSTREILGSAEPDISSWAPANGYKIQPTVKRGTSCLIGKKYIPMTAKGVKAYAIFYQPIYKEASKVITSVEFEPITPIHKDQATKYVIQAAPIAGTRPPTHQQKIDPNPNNPCEKNGGSEGRYTNDYIAEYFYAPGGSLIERVRVYNEGIR